MSAYGKVAVAAVGLLQQDPSLSPETAWKQAAAKQFSTAIAAREKGCPRGAFLGLCEAGLVQGVPPGTYTRSVKNKHYAMAAVEHLERSRASGITADELWDAVMDGELKKHNSQMDVVLALYQECLLRT